MATTNTQLKEWWETTLGQIVVFHYGKGLTADVRQEGRVPVYGSSGVTGYHNESLVKEVGYIIGRKGTVGSIYFSDQPFYPIDTVYYLTKKDIQCDFRFFFYLLQTLGLDRLNFDSAVPGLSRETAYSLAIKIPKSDIEQKSIAAVLSSLDDKIELLRRQNETLEQIAQAIFNEWFVKKAEGGKLPEGWRVGVLGDVLDVKGGTTPSTSVPEFWGGDIPWTTPKDLAGRREVFLFDTQDRISPQGLAQI